MGTFLYATLLLGRLWTVYSVGDDIYGRYAAADDNLQRFSLSQSFSLYEPMQESCRKLQREMDDRQAKYAYADCRMRKLAGKSLSTDVCDEPSEYER